MISDLIRKGVSTLKSDGPVQFLVKTSDFVYGKSGLRNTVYTFRFFLGSKYTKVCVADTCAKFRTRTYSEYERFHNGVWETPTLQNMLSDVTADDNFLDIGANVGSHSCLVGKKITEGTITSVEPHPRNVKGLEHNLSVNNINASIIQLGISDHPGTATLSEQRGESGDGKPSLTDEETGIQIKVSTIDDLVKNGRIPQPTVAKIDVEGAKNLVLKGTKETFSNPELKVIYCEIHPKKLTNFESSEQEVIDHLRGFGFKTEVIEQSGDKFKMVRSSRQ